MKLVALLLLAACSSKSTKPPPAKGSATPPAATAPPLDFADDIEHVQILSEASEQGVLVVRWHGAPYLAQLTCRVDAYNLVYLGSVHDAMNAAPGDHEALYRPDPFAVQPHACELRFYDSDHRILQAAACYRDGKLERGMCDQTMWAVPKLADGMTVDVARASVALTTSSGVAIKALITAGAKVPDKNTAFSIVCDGVASTPEAGEGLVPLSKLEPGETLYTWSLAFFMDKPLTAPPARCALTIANKTTLGTFCIAAGATRSGPCS